MTIPQEPTILDFLAAAKAAGLTVTRSRSSVNGKPAFRVEGKPGLFTKFGVFALIYGHDSENDEGQP